VLYARQELNRAKTLLKTGDATRELVDRRQQALNGAVDAVDADTAQAGAAAQALDAASQDVALDKVNISYNTLVAPRAGTIEYRIANIGEVLPAGGKVFTMLDRSDVYMDVYLPTAEAGRTRIGSEARIALDAYPGHAIPASVTFVAAQAQFTPKTVETKDERDSLMFRVRVRIDADRLRARDTPVKSGLPGVAYIRTDPKAVWPATLQDTAMPRGPGTLQGSGTLPGPGTVAGAAAPQGQATPQGLATRQSLATPRGRETPQGLATRQSQAMPQGSPVPQGSPTLQGPPTPQGPRTPQGSTPR
jgi:HlyD family secretion protein